jgi:hypothetical protein
MKPGTNVTVRLHVRTNGSKATIKPVSDYVQVALDPAKYEYPYLVRFPKWRLWSTYLEPIDGTDDEPYWCYFSADDPRLQVV